MNQKVGSTAKEDIRNAMRGLVGTSAKAEAERLAADHDTSWQHIYRMTKDLRNPTRKKRSDAGKRTFQLVEGTDVWYAGQLVLIGKLDPQDALDTAKLRGYTQLPSLEYFQRLLREHGLGKKQRRYPKRAFRRWEAEFPGELFQIDVTALKVRWIDEKTRRILQIEGVDKNHPQQDETKLRVWQIMLVDDHSRRRYLKYFTARAITSTEMVRFMCEAYTELGVPKKLYTDQGSEFKGRHIHAAKILNLLLASDGGYQHIPHAAGNAQATGKVENAHQWADKMDRLVGLAIDRGIEVTFEKLNSFADAICRNYNEVHVHRTTGEAPLSRWFGTRVTARMLPSEVIQAALLFDEAERILTDTWTIRVGTRDYRIPARDEAGNPSPFKVGMRLSVIVPDQLDIIYVTLENGDSYEVNKAIATADVAGDIKRAPESQSEQLQKQLKKHHKTRNAEAKEIQKTTGEVYQVPFFNHEVAVPDTNIKHFPHREMVISHEEIAASTPVPIPAAATYAGREIGYWEAVAEFSDRFDTKEEAKDFLLAIFPGKLGSSPASEIETAINGRYQQEERQVGLRAVS